MAYRVNGSNSYTGSNPRYTRKSLYESVGIRVGGAKEKWPKNRSEMRLLSSHEDRRRRETVNNGWRSERPMPKWTLNLNLKPSKDETRSMWVFAKRMVDDPRVIVFKP